MTWHPVEVTRDATFPPHTEHPIKLGKTTSRVFEIGQEPKLLRQVRVVMDVYMAPGESELIALLGEETFEVTFRRKKSQTPDTVSRVGEPE